MKVEKILSANLKEKINDEELGFGKYFTDHMFVMDYEEGRGWYSAKIVPYEDIKISPAAMVLHYGQSVFEGLKCYRTEDNRLLLFRPKDNFLRMNVSNSRMCIPEIDADFVVSALEELINVDKDWVPKKEGTSLYIRPFIFSTEAGLGVRPSNSYKFIIILSPSGLYYKEGLDPVKIAIEEEYVRAVKGGIGFTKATANYASSLKGQVKAKDKGYSQVLWLDAIEKKYIEEVGSMNIFFKIDNKVVTPSLEGSILPGITRDSVIKLLNNWGIVVEERKISIDELYDSYKKGLLQEVFGTGTAAIITPVGELNYKNEVLKVSNGKIGELTQKIYDELVGIQYGKIKESFDWIKEI